MSDNLKIKQPQDPTKVNIHEEWEVQYWCGKFNCTRGQLTQAVNAVGVLVSKVHAYLKGGR